MMKRKVSPPSFLAKTTSIEKKERLKVIARLITYSESMRAGRLANVKDLERFTIHGSKRISRLSKRTIAELGELTKSSDRLRRAIYIQSFLKIIVVTYFGASIFLLISPRYFELSYLSYLYNILLSRFIILLMITLGGAFLVVRQYTEKRFKEFFNRSQLERLKKRWKGIVQEYINMLNKEIKLYRENPKEFQFRLYHNDYKGIEIISKPSIISNFYVAIAKVESD